MDLPADRHRNDHCRSLHPTCNRRQEDKRCSRKVIVNSKNENILNNFEANIMLKDCIGSEKISKFKQKRLLKAKFKELDTLIKEEENKLVYKKHE